MIDPMTRCGRCGAPVSMSQPLVDGMCPHCAQTVGVWRIVGGLFHLTMGLILFGVLAASLMGGCSP